MKMSLKNNCSLPAKLNNSVIKETPPLEDIVIHPQTEEVTYKSQQYGFDNVTVTGVNLGEKTVIPTREQQIVEPESEDIGLSKVTVEPASLEEANVTPNVEEQVIEPTGDNIGLSKVTVAGDENLIPNNIRKDVEIFGVNGEFEGESELNAIIDTENVVNPQNFSAYKLIFFTQNVVEVKGDINLANVTNMQYMFYKCEKIKKLSFKNVNNITSLLSTFEGCKELVEISGDFSSINTTGIVNTFSGCSKLKKVPKIYGDSLVSVYNAFNSCNSLEDFGGIENLGKGYLTTQAENYSYYRLNLYGCNKLTHDSLMNVINGLYDIASIGVKQQTLQLGATNKAKLTAEEIAIATNKGWNVT